MKLWKLRFEDDDGLAAFAVVHAETAEHARQIAKAHAVKEYGGLGLWWIESPALEIIEVEPVAGVVVRAES